MPGGIENPVIGYTSFCVVKLLGYSLAAGVISKVYQQSRHGAFVIGTVRTLIGMAFGALYYFLWAKIAPQTVPGLAPYLMGLLPIRIIEWWLLLWVFYRQGPSRPRRDWAVVILGSVWSYVLDFPAAIGFFMTAGFWIC